MRRHARWIALGVIAVGVVVAWCVRGGPAAPAADAWSARESPDRVVPADVRIRVEVLNATTVRGLARQATIRLRDLGFDVVGSGNSAERLDSTMVLVRGGRMDWGDLAAKALGVSRVEARPDSSRYLDLTILLGSDWRPPPQAFHP